MSYWNHFLKKKQSLKTAALFSICVLSSHAEVQGIFLVISES